MDFLDPKQERRSQITLMLGYALITLAIAGATLILLYQAYGYNLNRQGVVTQSGLVFVSSQPSGSNILLNGVRYQSNTNTRVTVPAGSYTMQITRPGYRTWSRPIYVAGGDVQHFDYPLLVPSKLQTSPVGALGAVPTLVTQSLDHRWLLIDRPDVSGSFTLYDFKNPQQPVTTQLTLPDTLFTAGDGPQSWALEEWAADNRHVVLVHTYTKGGTAGHEYILLDTSDASKSVNLTTVLNLNQTATLSLFNNRTAQVYVYSPEDKSLSRINISGAAVVSTVQHVLSYKTYGDKQLLYTTDVAPAGTTLADGTVGVVLQDDGNTYNLRALPAGAPVYDLNLAQYSGDWYVVAGASTGNAVYVYKDPQGQQVGADGYPAPWRRLDIGNSTYVAFSSNTQFIAAESGQSFVVYDFENTMQYRYKVSAPLDAPQTHAVWMDGDRLLYVSGGRAVMLDYDDRNVQTLAPAMPAYTPVFDPSYRYLYAVAPDNNDAADNALLSSTPLLTPADL